MPIVYALVARGKTVLAEFTNTSGKLKLIDFRLGGRVDLLWRQGSGIGPPEKNSLFRMGIASLLMW